jgi:hypothetical protein
MSLQSSSFTIDKRISVGRANNPCSDSEVASILHSFSDLWDVDRSSKSFKELAAIIHSKLTKFSGLVTAPDESSECCFNLGRVRICHRFRIQTISHRTADLGDRRKIEIELKAGDAKYRLTSITDWARPNESFS